MYLWITLNEGYQMKELAKQYGLSEESLNRVVESFKNSKQEVNSDTVENVMTSSLNFYKQYFNNEDLKGNLNRMLKNELVNV
jgi:DNA-binding transcriptional regulator LsrR (DeoR family)